MRTNLEELQYLRLRSKTLGEEIKKAGREDQCLKMLDEALKKPATFYEITDDEWNAMLQKEQGQKLVDYYCGCRLRLRQLEKNMTASREKGKGLGEFLASPYVQTAIAASELAVLIDLVVKAAHAAGLFSHNERGEGGFGGDDL